MCVVVLVGEWMVVGGHGEMHIIIDQYKYEARRWRRGSSESLC